MKTLIRLAIILLLILGAVYFFTFRFKGKKVEIELKKEPGLQEVKTKAEEMEKRAIDTVKKAIPEGKIKGVRQEKPHQGIQEQESTEEDREALRQIIREKLKEDQK